MGICVWQAGAGPIGHANFGTSRVLDIGTESNEEARKTNLGTRNLIENEIKQETTKK